MLTFKCFLMCDTYRVLDFLLDKLVAGKIGHTHHGRRRHRGHLDGDIFKVLSSMVIYYAMSKWLNLATPRSPMAL